MAVSQQERAFQTLVENATDIIARFDRELRHVYVNAAVTRATGRPASDFIGRTNEELGMPPDLVALWADAIHRVFRTGVEETTEFSYRPPHGGVAWFRARLVPELAPDGSVETVISIARDITDARAAEEARLERKRREALSAIVAELQQANEKLRRGEERLRRLADANIIGVLMANDSAVISANDAFLDLVGYSRADLEAGAIDWRAMTPPEYLPLDEEAIARIRTLGACPPFEKEYIHKDGHHVPILIGASKLQDDPLEWVCFVLDLTSRKEMLHEEQRLRAEAEAASGAKDRLLAAASHELRTPLTTISGWLQILETEPDDEMRSVAFRSIRSAVAVQKRLVDDLLDAVRFSRGAVVIAPEPLDLSEVAREVAASMEPLSRESNVSLRVEAPAPVSVAADRARITQVLVNLLSNAFKFTPAGGAVTVRTGADGQAILEVIDTGCGIDPAFLPRIFDRFSQAHHRSTKGLGLGLSIVRDIVQQHGGTVTAHSDGEGHGARFIVRLPFR